MVTPIYDELQYLYDTMYVKMNTIMLIYIMNKMG